MGFICIFVCQSIDIFKIPFLQLLQIEVYLNVLDYVLHFGYLKGS